MCLWACLIATTTTATIFEHNNCKKPGVVGKVEYSSYIFNIGPNKANFIIGLIVVLKRCHRGRSLLLTG